MEEQKKQDTATGALVMLTDLLQTMFAPLIVLISLPLLIFFISIPLILTSIPLLRVGIFNCHWILSSCK